MVAYSFKARFAAPIQAGTKRQTIRARGRRPHAQPGQLVQLYTGMRTKACRKIIPDVVCEGAVPVSLDLRAAVRTPYGCEGARLSVAGRRLVYDEAEAFARADGFDSLDDMVRFWLEEHGAILFEGLCIRWRDAEPLGATDGL